MSVLPDGVPPEARRIPDGRWVVGQYQDGVPHGGWRYYDDTGETVEIAYFNEGVFYKAYRYYMQGTATVDLGDRTGEVVRRAGAPADLVRFADDLPPFPSRETMKIEFTMRDVNPAKGTFEVGDVTYYDGAGNRLSASGGAGDAPVPGAVLLKAGNDRMWRSGPRGTSGAWQYYELDGTPAFEIEVDRGVLAAVGVYLDGAWLRQRFRPLPGLATDELTIEHYRDRHVRSLRGKQQTLTPSKAPARTLVAKARTFFDPVLKTQGVRLCSGQRRVDRFSYMLCRKPFAVACIAEAGGGDEYVLVLEPGPYEGRVFLNFHDEGLFSVETLNEWVKDMLPELLGKNDTVKSVVADPRRLIPLTPFFQNPVADSVEAFISELRVELAEDWRKRLEPLAGMRWKNATKAPPRTRTLAASSRAPSRVRARSASKATAKAPAKVARAPKKSTATKKPARAATRPTGKGAMAPKRAR